MNTQANGNEGLSVDIVKVAGDGETRHRVTVRRGEHVLHMDAIKLDSSRSRTVFLNAVERRADQQRIEFDRERCEQVLMDHAAQRETEDSLDDAPERSADYRAVLEAFGIEILGEHDDQSIVFWVTGTGKRWRLKSPANWQPSEMLQALGESAGERLWRGKGDAPDGMYKPYELRDAVAVAAAAAPRLTANRLVGQGVWRHGARLLIVNGADAQLYDGAGFEPVRHPRLDNKIVDFNADKAWFDDMVEAVQQMDAGRAQAAFDELQEILRYWNWSHARDAEVVAALVPATFIQASWTWRPLVSIIGASDAGKSTLLQEVLVPIFGERCIAADRSSEAGLRQAIGCDAMPVVIDEFDKYRQRQQVLELFRTASRGGEILRGTQDQSGLRYGVRHLAWFAAIESGDIWGQDRNRFIRPELRPPENRGSLVLPGPAELRELGRRLAAAAIWAALAAVRMADAIKNERITGVHGRLVESFSVPAAMSTILSEGRDAGEETARDALRRMIEGRSVLASQGERDEAQLLNDIMTANVRVAQESADDERGRTIYVERSVSQILHPLSRRGGRTRMLPVNKEGLETLQAKGLKIINAHGRGKKLFLAPGVVRERLLAGTRWSGTNIDQLLMRLPGAERDQQRLGAGRASGVSLPWPDCLDCLDEEDRPADSVSDSEARG